MTFAAETVSPSYWLTSEGLSSPPKTLLKNRLITVKLEIRDFMDLSELVGFRFCCLSPPKKISGFRYSSLAIFLIQEG